jgi:hypothetical protein
MEITPEVLIEADNFHIEHQHIIRRLQAMPCYGVIPDSDFHAKITIENNVLSIWDLTCKAITPHGDYIDIDHYEEKVSLNTVSRTDLNSFYLVLKVNPYEFSVYNFEQTHIPYALPQYKFEICSTAVKALQGVPIARIDFNPEHNIWLNDEEYIVPCMTICSSSKLKNKYDILSQKLDGVLDLFKKQAYNDPLSVTIALLEVELKNYSGFESSAELVLLLKKIVTVFTLHYKEERKETYEEQFAKTETFLGTKYKHAEIADIIHKGIACLDELEAAKVTAPPPPPPPPPPTPSVEDNIPVVD